MPRLQINDKLRVRQYITSDIATVFYTEYNFSLRETASVDLQLQMKTISSSSQKSDHGADGPNSTTHHTRPIPLIDDYNSYYNDTDYGFDPYWKIHTYKQRHLFFNTNFDKPDVDIEPDSSQTEQALNQTLTNALVDPWQTNNTLPHLPNQHKPADVIPNSGPQVSLTTAVEARCQNSDHENGGTGLRTADYQSWT